MSKAEKLKIENCAGMAINELFGCNSVCAKRTLSEHGPKHQYDIHHENKIIGDVSTSPYLKISVIRAEETGLLQNYYGSVFGKAKKIECMF